MTRINCVPPQCLSNKHLLAEYKEITRPFNKVLKRIEQGTIHKIQIPLEYKLGAGHETFFFDKLKWLSDRYVQLFDELLLRGYNINKEQFYEIYNDHCDWLEGTEQWNDWIPTEEAMYTNMARLVKRSGIEPALQEIKAR